MKNGFLICFFSLINCVAYCSEPSLSDLSIDEHQMYVFGKDSDLKDYAKKNEKLSFSLGALVSSLYEVNNSKSDSYFFCPITLKKMILKLNDRLSEENKENHSLFESRRMIKDLEDEITKNNKLLYSYEKDFLSAVSTLLSQKHDSSLRCVRLKDSSDLKRIITSTFNLYVIWKKENEDSSPQVGKIFSGMFNFCDGCNKKYASIFQKVWESKKAREKVNKALSDFKNNLQKKITIKTIEDTIGRKNKEISYFL